MPWALLWVWGREERRRSAMQCLRTKQSASVSQLPGANMGIASDWAVDQRMQSDAIWQQKSAQAQRPLDG